ncbi:hypothetical protein [Selenomonas ruminis]|uniref:Uncharacterized protein n=1 Tax=Selenomonas ruminis TaxID=2593411 RepID=A0A5D6WAX3_9FIRM|nr:hypothetical protein [Selenomonas sp. mPRGC5]TYZ24139.1 hypothetical protein FZ040_05335 [Selenomonas sp. mPRGC5]
MSRKARTPEEQARRKKIRALLQESNVTSMEDIQNLFKETEYTGPKKPLLSDFLVCRFWARGNHHSRD